MSQVAAVGSAGTTPEVRTSLFGPKTLGQDDFLKLLVTQLSNQDPMSPKADTDFFAEMATFSSVEQLKSMQGEMVALREAQELTQAHSFLGRTVTVALDDDILTSGLVSAVQLTAGRPQLIVDDVAYDLNQVQGIGPAGA